MAKIEVRFTVEMTQTIDWSDDELEDFNYDNLVCNCDPEKARVVDYEFDITNIKLNDKPYNF